MGSTQNRNHSMQRIWSVIALGALSSTLLIGIVFAQTPPAKFMSPSEIAATSEAMIEKQEACRKESRQQKLSYLKRRKFIKSCMSR
jgi:hypothetical protein